MNFTIKTLGLAYFKQIWVAHSTRHATRSSKLHSENLRSFVSVCDYLSSHKPARQQMRSLAFYRETGIFPPIGLKKPLKIFKQFLVHVIMLVRPTNSPNLGEIGLQVAPPHNGEMSRFCDFGSPFFRFFISPTGRNSGPICTHFGSNDVFCLVKVSFWGFEPSNSLLGGLQSKKHQNFDPSSDCRFAEEIALALKLSRINDP